MVELVELSEGKSTTTSKVIADVFGKAHRNVMRDIKGLDCSDEFRALNFEHSEYVSPQNKKFTCCNVTRDGFAFLAMGYTGKEAAQWKEAYIAAFNKMELFIRNEARDLSSQINMVSKQIDQIAEAGSAWGKTGCAIRKEKTRAITELNVLIDHAQMQLHFGGE